jgi:hypothetical protein
LFDIVSTQGRICSEQYTLAIGDFADSERLVLSAAYFVGGKSQASNAETCDCRPQEDQGPGFAVDNDDALFFECIDPSSLKKTRTYRRFCQFPGGTRFSKKTQIT